MNNIREIIKVNKLHPIYYKKIGKVYLIKTKKDQYIIKNNTNNYDIYSYLASRDFNNFPPNYSEKNNHYDLSLFIDDTSLNNEQKLDDLINVLSLLHHKTTFNREIDLDEIKEVYENLKEEINNGITYYQELNDYIDKQIFYSPCEYLFIRNISLIYYLYHFCQYNLDKWFNSMQNKKTIRNSLIHNNVSLEHLLINKNLYLISWDKALFSSSIDDLYNFYKKYYNDYELSNMLNNYKRNNNIDNDDELLLLIRLALPKKIDFHNNYSCLKEINELIIYSNKIYQYVNK